MVKKIKIMVRNVQDVGIRYWWKFCIIYVWLSCWERKMSEHVILGKKDEWTCFVYLYTIYSSCFVTFNSFIFLGH